jgi:ribosome-associated heat shock protein Hsp15
MRIDRLLYALRFAKSRTLAQRWITEGHMRRNGERVTRQDLSVAVGDVLTLPLRREVLVIELLALPSRRGPASEARACYRPLDAGGAKRIAGGEVPGAEMPWDAEGKAQQ